MVDAGDYPVIARISGGTPSISIIRFEFYASTCKLVAKAGHVGRKGRRHVLKLNIPQRHREWFEGIWDRAKSFDLPFRFAPANTS